MTDDDLIRKYGGSGDAEPPKSNLADESQFYFASGGPVPSVDLRFENGNCVGIPYSEIRQFRWDRSEGITLVLTEGTATIKGPNLEEVYRHLLLNRVVWVEEHADHVIQNS